MGLRLFVSVSKTLEKLFSFKDSVKNFKEKYSVEYSRKCDTFDAEYLGKTERILSQRVYEHQK